MPGPSDMAGQIDRWLEVMTVEELRERLGAGCLHTREGVRALVEGAIDNQLETWVSPGPATSC